MSSEIPFLPEDIEPLIRSVVLADQRHRRILALLQEHSGPIPERDLVEQLAAREAERSAVTDQVYQRIQIDLHHRCLPELEAAGWVERCPGGIITTKQLAVERMDALPELEDPDVPWKALAALLAHPQRQHVVSIIADHTQSLTLEELGTALRASEQRSRTTDEDGEESTLLAVLHHIDLPALEEVGLIEYDSDEKTITRQRALETLLDRTDIGSSTNDATDANS